MIDGYDPRLVFDDFYGIVTGEEHAPEQVAARLINRAKHRRLHVPSSHVVGASYDPTYRTFEVADITYRIIGDDSTDMPVFDKLHEQFTKALPTPKHVRLDDDASYAEFRQARKDPYVAALEARLTALEQAVAAHVADNHGGGKLAILRNDLDNHILWHAAQAHKGGEPISLPLQDAIEGKIEAWQDGDELLCSVRVPGPDGLARIITSGAPVESAVEEVVSCGCDEGFYAEDIADVALPVAQLVGVDKLLTDICGVALDFVACGSPCIGVMMPTVDPSLAAAMALIQRCQSGDVRACKDAKIMMHDHKSLFDDACARLCVAQAEKGRSHGR